jgi:hypothetical protein
MPDGSRQTTTTVCERRVTRRATTAEMQRRAAATRATTGATTTTTAATTVARRGGGGDGGDDDGEASGGSGATTGGGVASEGGPAKRQRGERGGRKTDRQPARTKEGHHTASIRKQGPCLGAVSGLARSAGLSEDHGAPRDFSMGYSQSRFFLRSLRQRPRAPHAYFAEPVRGRRAV